MTGISGVRHERRTTDFVAATETIRPLRDRIVIEPLDWSAVRPGSRIIAIRDGKPVRGRVLAVGPGTHRRRYNRQRVAGEAQKFQRSYVTTRTFVPVDVKVGDIVELGGLELKGYDFPTVNWGGRECLIIQEQDVCGVYGEA